MPKYRVYLATEASLSVTVEAEDPEAAMEGAFDMAPSDVCAQCSGWGRPWILDMGEWEIAREYVGNEANGREIEPELVED